MKKYIVSLLIIFSVLFSYIPTTLASGNDYTLSALSAEENLVYGKYELSAELTVKKNTNTESGTLLLAFYSDNGFAVGIKSCKVSDVLSLNGGESNTYSTGVLTFDKQVKSIKAMVWDEASHFAPIADKLTLNNIQLTTAKHYAIAECYNDVSVSGDSSSYDYIDVMTLDGESERLYIDSNAETMAGAEDVIKAVKGSPLSASGVDSLTSIALDKRVIEYTVKKSDEKIYDIGLVTAVPFTQEVFSNTQNTLYKPLSPNVTVIDATEYFKKGASATVQDYALSSVSELYDGIKYDGFLVQPNSNNQYEHLVFTSLDYLAVNATMLTNLRNCSADIQANQRSFPVGYQRSLILTIKACIDNVINDGSTNIINKEFIKKKYQSDVDTAKGYYNAIQADTDLKASFNKNLSTLNSATLTWLGTEFGVIAS